MAKENKIQSAITGSLQVYCQHRNLHIFAPYANQQGAQLRRYCGDVFGLLEGADLIALEVKEYDVHRCELPEFDPAQHAIAVEFERLGVPLAYAYNNIETLPYHNWPQPAHWAEKTLKAIKRSSPTLLPGERPDVQNHSSLFDWLNGSHAHGAPEKFGRLHGALQQVDNYRNGILVLLYSDSSRAIATFNRQEIESIMKVLNKEAHLSEKQRKVLQRVMGESALAFDRFVKPTSDDDHAQNNTPPRFRG